MFPFGKKNEDDLTVYMAPVEYGQVLGIVATLQPKRVLEWGAGGSTRALLERFSFIETYVSIEHDARWFEKVREKVTDPRLQLHLCEPNQPLGKIKAPKEERIAWDRRAEVEPAIMADYVRLPQTLGMEFDFVLVDGRARSFCVVLGFSLLVPGGGLVVHDAQREEYHQALHSVGQPLFLEPWESGQVCLVKKSA